MIQIFFGLQVHVHVHLSLFNTLINFTCVIFCENIDVVSFLYYKNYIISVIDVKKISVQIHVNSSVTILWCMSEEI